MVRSLNRFTKLALVVSALSCAPSAFGQGAYVPARSVNSNVNGVLRPVAGATITVCAAGNANVPCAPPLAGVLFKDQALTQPLTNPTTTDLNGNYPTMAIAAGNYTITETAVGFTGFSYQITVTCGTGSCTATSLTVTGTTTLAATTATNLTVSGTLQCKNFEGVLCVDSTNTQSWTGTDIGGWLNSAYAAGPSTGAEIWQACNQSGTSINFSTPIVFQTSGKYVAPRSLGPTNQNGLGCGLNYTPVTATKAMTLDFTPSGGGGYEPGDLFGIHLINNGCVGSGGTNGGCGSSATGIAFGATNGGGHMLKVHGRVAGFGTGINFGDLNGVGWGVGFDQFGCAWNTTCMSFPIYHENIHWIGGACAVNTTCISNSSGSDIEMFGVSIDSNLSASGWINPTGQITCWACHFENLGSGNAAGTQPFLISGQSGGVYNFSGVAINDNANVGSLAALFSATAGTLYWTGQITSPNQTITNIYNNSPGAVGHLSYFTANAANVGPACATPFYCIVERFGYAGGPNFDIPIFRQPADVLGTITGSANYATFHLDALNVDERVNYNNSAPMGFAPLVVSRATTSQRAETGSADTNVVTLNPAGAIGTYRACVSISVSSATAGVISWTLSWTDSSGNAQANIVQNLTQIQPAGTPAAAQSFTTSAAGNYSGCTTFDVNNAGAAIVVKWVGGGTTAAKMSATIERLI